MMEYWNLLIRIRNIWSISVWQSSSIFELIIYWLNNDSINIDI